MKNIIYICLAIIAICTMISCKKFLEAEPTDKVTGKQFWTSATNAERFLTDIYATTFPEAYEGCIFFDEVMSDNAYMTWSGWFTDLQLLANGTQDAYGAEPATFWAQHYSNIRKCNLMYENIEKIPNLPAQQKSILLAETKFLETYNYNRLLFFFEKIPLVTKVLTPDESKKVKQSDKAAVLKHMIAKLDEAIATLSGVNLSRGRTSWGACMTLKARVLLYQNKFADLLPVTTQLIGKYSLNTAGNKPYENLFNGTAEDSNEIIFSLRRSETIKGPNAGHIGNQVFFLKGMSGGDALLASTPSGTLVDSYPMANGQLIKEPGSGYNPSQPYVNRDPRFYQSIIYPTAQIKYWTGNEIASTLYDPEDEHTLIKLNQYEAPEPSPTGYMWNKYVQWTPRSMVQITDCSNDQIIMRYADVLLMHAEALLETRGVAAKNEVLDIIDQLRRRVHGGLVNRTNYNAKNEILNLLRNERRIELANEGTRYFDIIRWKIAEKSAIKDGFGLHGDFYGALMRKDGVGAGNRTITVDGVERRYVETRNFLTPKHYLQPIPQAQRDLNNNLVQNTGW